MCLTYMDKQDNSVAGLHPYQTLTIPLKHRTRLDIYKGNRRQKIGPWRAVNIIHNKSLDPLMILITCTYIL